jgi:hypothetical protein
MQFEWVARHSEAAGGTFREFCHMLELGSSNGKIHKVRKKRNICWAQRANGEVKT